MTILALVDAPDHVCCRYRIRAFAPALAREGIDLNVLPIPGGSLRRGLFTYRLPRVEALILQRRLLPTWTLRLLRKRTRRLIFDFDDAVMYRDSYDPRGPDCPRRAERFRRTVELADLVIAGNDFLADCALRAGATPDQVRVIPTCIPVERYAPKPVETTNEPGPLELVWIGSSSTLQGLEQTKDLWERLVTVASPGAIRLRVICDRFPSLGRMPVVPVPWSEATEAAEIARGDIGVTWVPNDVWSRGKCGLKLLQYQAAGLPVLANPVGVHREMVTPGIHGFLPETEDHWLSATRFLLEHPEQRRTLGRNARDNVVSNYSVQSWEPAFVSAVLGRSPVQAPHFEAAEPWGLKPNGPAPRSPHTRSEVA